MHHIARLDPPPLPSKFLVSLRPPPAQLSPAHPQHQVPAPVHLHPVCPFDPQPNPPRIAPCPHYKVVLHFPLPPVVLQIYSRVYSPISHPPIRRNMPVPPASFLPHQVIA